MIFRHTRQATVLGLGLVLLLTGCQREQSQGRAVYFGPTAVYRLNSGTQEVAPDSASIAFYQQRFNFHPRFNQPLHRLVRSSGPETIYLGLVMPPAPRNLAVLAAPDSVWQPIATRVIQPNNASLSILRNSRRGEYDVRYIGRNEKTGNVHVINLLTTDSTVAYSYYKADKLFKGDLIL